MQSKMHTAGNRTAGIINERIVHSIILRSVPGMCSGKSMVSIRMAFHQQYIASLSSVGIPARDITAGRIIPKGRVISSLQRLFEKPRDGNPS